MVGEDVLLSNQCYESIFIGWGWWEASNWGLGALTVIEELINVIPGFDIVVTDWRGRVWANDLS
jgi:hypothetical protein